MRIARALPALLLAALPALAADLWLPAAPGRVRALGGCFAALSSPADAHLYNPAGLARLERKGGLAFSLDPLAARIRPAAQDEDWDWAPVARALQPLRRLEWRGTRLAVSLAPVEWLPEPGSPAKAGGSAEPATGQLAPSLTAAMALDRRVRLGISATAYLDPDNARRRVGVAYGALVRANRIMDVGGQAIYLPVGALERRLPLDRLGDSSVNVGLACYPFGRDGARRRGPLLLALDVRNVTQEAGLSRHQEAHLGVEGRLPGGLDLRLGNYWPVASGGEHAKMSGGIGWSFGRGLAGATLEAAWLEDPFDDGHDLWTAGLRWPR